MKKIGIGEFYKIFISKEWAHEKMFNMIKHWKTVN
jgi:hypothetical protein